ncbi:hypothetical protein C1645_838570 [Glomus cerebriforme]|uniref:Uncharacterized protein n=1 Tax=Glomus cerebriforme TaxID=658196 RepID=A0A397S282_9GLOM|nr:hypothetical protein C1645_838570 [Glomus cerebriforme]
MSDDEIDTEMEEGYNEFIKEYGLRENWRNETWDDWDDWDDLFLHNQNLLENKGALFDVFLQSNAFYLPQILSLIELPYSAEELRWEICHVV